VTKLQFWIRPALIITLWIVAAAFTLSELATAVPALVSMGEPRSQDLAGPRVRARKPVHTRVAVQP